MYEPFFHVVLHEPEIPYNAGNIGRTCAAVCAKLWMVRPLGFRLSDHYLRRAGLDYWDELVWEVVDDWAALSARLSLEQAWFFSKSAGSCYTDARFQAQDVLVFGSESRGLPPTILSEHRTRSLRLPMAPRVRSLNLSNAVAVSCFELLRQTGMQPE